MGRVGNWDDDRARAVHSAAPRYFRPMRHAPEDQRRTLWLFAALALYLIAQSTWWAWLLVNKDRELEQVIRAFELRPEGYAPVNAARTFWMVAGEGMVFVVLVLAALWIVYRAVRHELVRARQQRDFLLAVSHELRTPVAGMKLHLQTLERTGLTTEERVALHRRALADVTRLGDLTERIMLATRLEETDAGLTVARHAIDPLLTAAVARAAATFAADRPIVVSGEGHEALLDPAAFASVIDNLLENAVKYSPAGSGISVVTQEVHGRVILTVSDRGTGVPDADRDRIFEKFHRGRRAIEQQTKGTGLGLFIVHRLMRAMHGTITAMDRDGGGATFAASFPTR